MGWDFTNRDATMNDMDFFNAELAPHTVLAAFNHRDEQAVYLAVRLAGEDGGGHVLGLVTLYEWANGRCNYGYKLIEEGCGPVAASCPPAILDLLSPVETLYPTAGCGREHAAQWRERCRRRHRMSSVCRDPYEHLYWSDNSHITGL